MKYAPFLILFFFSIALFTKMATHERSPASVKVGYASCLDDFSRFMRRHSNSGEDVLETTLGTLPKWKAFLLRKLWKSEVESGKLTLIQTENKFKSFLVQHVGITPLSHHYYVNAKKEIWLPYGMNLPWDIFQFYLKQSKKMELRTKDYVVIPSKMVLTNMIDAPFSAGFFIFSLAGGGTVLSAEGFFAPNPIIDESDTSDFEEDEISLIISMIKEESSGISAIHEIEKSVESSLGRTKVLHVETDSLTENQIREEVAKLTLGKRVRKIIISSHGEKETLYADDYSMSLNQFSKWMKKSGILKNVSDNLEIHFAACLIAENEKAENEVRKMATDLLPSNGKLVANKTLGNASLSLKSNLDFQNSLDGAMDAFSLMTNPQIGEGIRYLTLGAGIKIYSAIRESDPELLTRPSNVTYYKEHGELKRKSYLFWKDSL